MAIYMVKNTFVYEGKMYKIGEEVQILEKEILENCIERGLIIESDSNSRDDVTEKDKDALLSEEETNKDSEDLEDLKKAGKSKKK
jgi:hypothetical protein|nr:MAG TPA: hypothetical protein [Caudoviricetes sp.]